jgi:ribosomal protein L11 methyltransferase
LTWQQLTLSIDSAEAECAEALLTLAGALALAFDDAGDDPVLEPLPGSTPLWPTVNIRALFPATLDLLPLCRVLQSSLSLRAPIAVQTLADDWRSAPKEITPRPVGRRLWIAPAGSAAAPPSGRVGIRLNMGLAFGTGAHPTTALCLEWLDANVVPGATLLDYGCGSGVLAVAALALGAHRAWAVDNDPQALAATADNARLNGVEEKLWIGPPEALPSSVGAARAGARRGARPPRANRLERYSQRPAGSHTRRVRAVLRELRQRRARGLAPASGRPRQFGLTARER